STGAYAEAGYSSAAAFFRHACGRAPGRARELVAGGPGPAPRGATGQAGPGARAGERVAVGRALPRLDATGQAVRGGDVSYDAAHVICRTTAQIAAGDLAAAAEREMLTATTAGLPGSRSAAEAVSQL